MSLKIIFKTISLSLFIALALPLTSGAINTNNPFNTPADSLADVQTAARITARVYEIQSMDKANLSSAEKKSLKNELKEMKKTVVEGNGRGVYLSIGAIIIIILLLILIL